MLGIDVVHSVVAVSTPALGIHVARIETDDFKAVLLGRKYTGLRRHLGEVTIGANILELLPRALIGAPVVGAPAKTCHQGILDIAQIETLLHIEVQRHHLVDRIRLCGADIVADIHVAIEAGRVAPRTASRLGQVPCIGTGAVTLHQEADTRQLRVGTLEEALAGVAEVELCTGKAGAQDGFPRLALIFQFRRDQIGRRTGITV